MVLTTAGVDNPQDFVFTVNRNLNNSLPIKGVSEKMQPTFIQDSSGNDRI